MKTMKMIGVGVAFCLMTAIVLAEAKQQDPLKLQRGARNSEVKRPDRQSREARMGMSREEMYKQRMARMMKTHKAGIDELEAIKKIAQEEEAVRTVKALQTMIDKKDKQFKDSLAKFENSRLMRAEKVKQRNAQIKPLKIDDDDDDKKEQPTVRPKTK